MMGMRSSRSNHLYQSIDCFSLTASLRSKYSIQIAAALDYLAEIEQIRGNFTASLAHQKEAIKLTENKTAEPSIFAFYISLGMTYYQLKDYEQGRANFPQGEKQL